jgi:hypothetical protein
MMNNDPYEKYPNEVADLSEAIARLKQNKAKIKAKTEDFARKIRNQQLSEESINRKQ